MKIQVLKKDGSVENFDPQKISNVTLAAGLTEDQSQKLAQDVTAWVESLNKEQVSSTEIRNKVTEELGKIDEYTAGLYNWYEKTKEKNQYPSTEI